MSNFRLVGILLGAVLVWQGYIQKKVPQPTPSPNPVINVDTDPDSLPQAPSGSVAASSQPLVTLLTGQSDDAIKLARAFKGWSELLGRSTKITTTAQFQKVYVDATRILLEKHQIAGKYQGKIDTVVNATVLASFTEAGLVENGTVKSMEWNAATSAAAVKAFDAVSYQCYMAFQGS